MGRNYPHLPLAQVRTTQAADYMTVLTPQQASLPGTLLGGAASRITQAKEAFLLFGDGFQRFENQLVLLPSSAPWLCEYVKELTTFPGTKFDDQVDSTTQALDYMSQNRSLKFGPNSEEDTGARTMPANWIRVAKKNGSLPLVLHLWRRGVEMPVSDCCRTRRNGWSRRVVRLAAYWLKPRQVDD